MFHSFNKLVLAASMIMCATNVSAVTETNEASRYFQFNYEVEIPAQKVGSGPVDVFIPLPTSDKNQTILNSDIVTSIPGTIKTEPTYGNSYWHGRIEKPDGKVATVKLGTIVNRNVALKESARTIHIAQLDEKQAALFLKNNTLDPEKNPILDQMYKDIPFKEGATQLEKARAIYDFVVDNMEYKKVGTGWGNGDTFWACSERYGNCTDFHALFISLAKKAAIPARFEIGFPVPEDKVAGNIGGYHCWVEFYTTETGWFPIDASEAKKHPEKRELLFGSHPADRIQFTVGRDIELGEGHKSKPLNYFIYPLVEANGQKIADVKTAVSYKGITLAELPNYINTVKPAAGAQ